MALSEITSQLPALSFAELQELHEATAKAIKDRAEAERKELLAKMEAMARENGFAGLDAVLGSKSAEGASKQRKRGSVPPKYRNPSNAEQTWTGRGRKPKWVEEALAAGATLDEMLIDKA